VSRRITHQFSLRRFLLLSRLSLNLVLAPGSSTDLSVSEPYNSPRLARPSEPTDAGEQSVPFELRSPKPEQRHLPKLPPSRDRRVMQSGDASVHGGGPDVFLASTPVRAEWLKKQLLGCSRDNDDDSP
jgi:hypothetical protein